MPQHHYDSTAPTHLAPRFMLAPLIPLDKDFLREVQTIAVNNPQALQAWAENFEGDPSQEAIYFDEKEWRGLNPRPARHRIDLYAIQRGLHKMFEAKYQVSIASRQMVVRALFEQGTKPGVLNLQPQLVSAVIQLAIFDQVVW